MKKYRILFFASILAAFFSLQIFSINNETADAANLPDKTIQCHCNTPNAKPTANGDFYNENFFTCPGGNPNPNHCGHQEEQCVDTPGNDEQDQQVVVGRAGSYTIHYVGVSCQTISVCECNGNNIQCYVPVGGKKTQTEPFTCGTGTSCIAKPGVNDTNFSYLNRPVTGVACVSKCKCQHPGAPTAKNNSTGPGQNGYTCANDPNVHYCPNQEDYCDDKPSGTLSISCINSSKCTCNGDKSSIVCSSPGSGNNGQNESQSFTCNGPGTCIEGKGVDDPNFKFANQHITGIKCGPPPTIPPPPSPPCLKWTNGTCTAFDSAFGGTKAGGFSTDPSGFIQEIFAVLLSVSGGIALLLIMKAGYQMMTAQGNPEKLNNAREQLVAAIVGLVFLIFSFVFLTLIGFDILHIPGFKP